MIEFADKTVTRCSVCSRFKISGKPHYCQVEESEPHAYLDAPESYSDHGFVPDVRNLLDDPEVPLQYSEVTETGRDF